MHDKYTNEAFEKIVEQEHSLDSEVITKLIQEIKNFYKEFNDKLHRCTSRYIGAVKDILNQFPIIIKKGLDGKISYSIDNKQVIEVADIEIALKKYVDKFESIRYLDFLSEEKRNVVFVGPNGCGKTTLLRKLRKDTQSASIYYYPADRVLLVREHFNPKREYDAFVKDLNETYKYATDIDYSLQGSKIIEQFDYFINLLERERNEENEKKVVNGTTEKIIKKWGELVKDRELFFEHGLCVRPIGGKKYPLKYLSSGEKSILYFLIGILLQEKKDYYFIDEPENNLNPSIVSKLWSFIEREMTDSVFVYLTGPRNIANILREKKILKPTMYRFQEEGKYGAITDTTDIYGWNDRTVAGILDNEIYLGHTINCRTTVVSYKDKRTKIRPESEWYRVENTHEAIIDKTTWELAQAVRQGKRRRTTMGGIDKYSGLLYCADCNSKLYFIRGTTLKPDAYGFICSRYRKHMGEKQCTPHSIRAKVLDEIILEEIRKVTYYARAQTREFVSFINQKSSAENRRELNARMVEFASLEKRNNELNALFRRLYEDNVLGKVTNEQFRMLSDGYNTEQREITERLPIVKQEIENLKAAATNVERFVDISNKYTDLRELTPEVLRTFIERIIIHERTAKHSKTATQQIDIYFRYIGKLAPEAVA